MIICGDFNFVTSPVDRNSTLLTSIDKAYKNEWESLEINIGLIDSFRVTNLKRRLYTYTHTNGVSKSRLDRIYISKDLSGKVISTNTEYASESDHKFVNLTLANEVEHGPGQWIFKVGISRKLSFFNF